MKKMKKKNEQKRGGDGGEERDSEYRSDLKLSIIKY